MDTKTNNLTMARDCAAAREASGAEPDAVQKVTVTWYVDVLGFPEFTAKVLYTNQMLMGKKVLADLTENLSMTYVAPSANREEPAMVTQPQSWPLSALN